MHAQIGKPRQTCLLMELYARQRLADVEAFPVPPEQARQCLQDLAVMGRVPGFYRRLAGSS